MTELRRTRTSNGESSIYEAEDGIWHGYVTMGVKSNGKPDRRHRQGKNREQVFQKVQALEQDRAEGVRLQAGGRLRVSGWLTYWLENVLRESTANDYRTLVENHLIPGLGDHWLEHLEPEHIEAFYRQLHRKGLAQSTVLKIHRVLSSALTTAHRRKKVRMNVLTLIDPPTVDPHDTEAMTAVEAKAVIVEALKDERLVCRWALSMEVGCRQGEALGLQWSDVSLDPDTFQGKAVLRRQLRRSRARHGCEEKAICPAKQPIRCPKAIGGGLVILPHTKNKKKRTVTLSSQLVAALLEHRDRQDAEREAAGTQWTGDEFGDLVFRQPNGRPLDPRADYEAWVLLLKRAGVARSGTHAARRTATTLMLEQGIPLKVVQEIGGWSSSRIMLDHYAAVHDSAKDEAASRMGVVLWG